MNDLTVGLTDDPGVYMMKNAEGKILYIGKAGNLKKRVSSYFVKQDRRDIKTRVLIKKIAAIETIVTTSEKEALILEANLIRRHRPRYNVNLKDDKRYPILRLDVGHPWPDLTVVRKMEKDGALYFGPYSSSGAMRRTVRFIHKTFRLRKCKATKFGNRTRPCLNYQMGTCLAPCCLDVDPTVYTDIVREVVLLLKGRTPELIRKIKNAMADASAALDFETAAELRDRMRALERTVEKQVCVSADFGDRDVLAHAGSYEFSVMTLLSVRGGFLLGSRNFPIEATFASDGEIARAFIRQYYESAPFIPGEILVSVPIEESSHLMEWLGEIKGKKVRITHPRRGEKAQLMKTAVRNADVALREFSASREANRDILSRLGERLDMKTPPAHIECFDNSNISGTDTVSGMVVFKNGKPDKSSYRKYKIRTATGGDDYGAMAEVLTRRFGKGEESEPHPDLLVVDGGKGQLNIAIAVLAELGIDTKFQVAGIAKKNKTLGEKRDKIYLPGRSNSVNFGKQDDLLLFLQRIRDESHRFAIAFHRKRRSTVAGKSILDDIPGIGAKRKKTLFRHFGSVKKIREATVEELVALPGINTSAAKSLKNVLSRKQ